MRFIFSLIILFFLIFPTYAYDEKIKLNRTNIDTDSKKETIKVNLNEMLDVRKIKKASKKYASIERYVKETSRKIFKKGKRTKYKGVAVNIFKNNANAVVYIGNEKDHSMGTGSIMDKNGTIITNWHVVGNASKVQIWLKPDDLEKMDERVLMYEPNYTGTVIKKNKRKDLALIKVEGFPTNIKIIRFGKTSNLPVGSTVYSIGHPGGQTWTFNSGMVTQIRPSYKWSYENSSHAANIIQHEVPTNPGNSGGPLFNEKGMMVGVNSFQKSDSELINFSVAVEEVEKFLMEKIKKEKKKYIQKKKKPTYITKKCKEKSKYLQKKCKKEQSSKAGVGIKKTYPNAIPGDVNGNGIEDVWYIDDNKNGKIDTAFVDHDEDGIIEAIMIDDNENNYFEIITIDKDLNGYPDLLYIDQDEDGEDDVVAYDYNEDGEWDKYEKPS